VTANAESLLKRAEREGWAEWIRTPCDRLAVEQGYYFDLKSAERVRYFFRKFLRHAKGRRWTGKPFELLPWQWQDVIGPLFGWKRPNGLRRFTQSYLTVAKKNGKSELASGIALYMLCGDAEPGAEVYCAANDRKQAALVWRQAELMARQSPELMKRLTIVRSTHRIVYDATSSFMGTLSAETATSEGIDASCCTYDEVHMARSRVMHDVLRFAGDARDQPLFLMITTAGDDVQSICYEVYAYAKDVLAGKIKDLSFLPVIYEAPDEAPVDDPATWALANPSYGVLIGEEKTRQAADEALHNKRKLRNFRRRKLNQWVDDVDGWLSLDQWQELSGDLPSDDYLATLPCFGGLDLADTDDINALALIFVDQQRLWIKVWLWCPEQQILRRDREGHVPYAQWAADGYLLPTHGSTTDYDRIEQAIRQAHQRYQLRELGYDDYNAPALTNRLTNHGVPCVKVPQVLKHLSPACKQLEILLARGVAMHEGNPGMDWMVDNAMVYEDPNQNIRPDKKRSRDKIDGVGALVTALNRVLANTADDASPYQDRGFGWLEAGDEGDEGDEYELFEDDDDEMDPF